MAEREKIIVQDNSSGAPLLIGLGIVVLAAVILWSAGVFNGQNNTGDTDIEINNPSPTANTQ